MRISDWSSDVCSSDLCSSNAAHAERKTEEQPRHRANLVRRQFLRKHQNRRERRGQHERSEERSVGKDVSVRVDLGGRRIIKKKTIIINYILEEPTHSNN